jgi:hypothetical protein
MNNANFVPFKNGKCLNEQLQNEKGAKIQLPSSNYEEYLKLVETNDIFRSGELNQTFPQITFGSCSGR